MLQRQHVAILAMLLAMEVAPAKANSPYSSRPYRSADNWVWDTRGVWVGPNLVKDPKTGKMVRETRNPAVINCCDETGLSFPNDAVNADVFAPKQPKAAPRKPQQVRQQTQPRQEQPQKRDTLEQAIAKVKTMNLAPDVEEAAIRAIRQEYRAPPQSAAISDGAGSIGRSRARGGYDGNWTGKVACSWGSSSLNLSISGNAVTGKLVNGTIFSGQVSGRSIGFQFSNFLNTATFKGNIDSPNSMSGTYTQSMSGELCQWTASR